ncbi:DUF4433 domain-containing protein [Streptomyces globosus]|uniref:DUF4433 domain-containing protein n=1 Tax=Streptomyces globosus TaxID=68209 RepID=UPI003828C844
MERSRVGELHYITSIENVESIAERGLLSHLNANSLPHRSVALESVQDLRRDKRVPSGGLLHSYANLYFDARNPMMYRLIQDGHKDLIVVRVSSSVLDLPNAVLSDGNAAAGTTRFYRSPDGLKALDESRVYAASWNHADIFEKTERKRQRCAEALIPESVGPDHIFGCYTLVQEHMEICVDAHPRWKVEVNRNVYFR